ncbi:hypothetical protein ACLOJK_021154 [Asimina triloba]
MFPADRLQRLGKGSHGGEASVTRSKRVGEFSLLSNTVVLEVGENSSSSNTKGNAEVISETVGSDRYRDHTVILKNGRDPDGDSGLNRDRNPDKGFSRDINPSNDFALKKHRDPDNDFGLVEDNKSDDEIPLMKDGDPDDDFVLNGDTEMDDWFSLEKDKYPDDDFAVKNHPDPDDSSPVNSVTDVPDNSTSELTTDKDRGVILEKTMQLEGESSAPAIKNSIVVELDGGGKMDTAKSMVLQNLDPNSSDLNKSASLNVNSKNRGMTKVLTKVTGPWQSDKPRWPSACDKELLSAKKLIENAPILKDDDKLYAPAFRNISMFKRSYELMERILKVYVYKDGARPIFHKPLLKGIYASEGWFMKLMEGNKHYVVKDPRKAHLFYLPFSSRLLQFALYVPRSHDHKNLIAFLKNYIDRIAAKHPFWNRTSGADHFLVACHDWAPAETRHNMERSIRVLCNSDLFKGFKLGKDVSLPETYVRSGQNPLRDLGGEPPSKRPTLAFYAGNMHGSLRPILLKYWENKDPNMKIIGPMSPGVESKMTYIHHMKTSKYCICPRGHGVNSPRVVEAIFYECVPVIISDNYVPPFFEVLNWEAFSVFMAEKDVPKLKDILMSIPQERYLIMQMGVKKVQQHLLWHSKPVKYDIFHMILHSVWFNRLHQIRI